MKLRRGIIRFTLSLLLAGGVGVLLAGTIYLTEYDPRWLVFLGGVLFAAVLSLASQASKAEWLLARRRRQVERLRGQLAAEAARSRNASVAFQAADLRLRKLGETLRSVVLFVDREQVCRLHNPPAALVLARKNEPVDGRPLRELFGEATYAAMRPYLEKSLAGAACSYELLWSTPEGASRYAVRQVPVWAGASAVPPEGVCLLITPALLAQGLSAPHPAQPLAPAPAGGVHVPSESGETLYLRAIARELTGWDDPKTKLLRALNENRFVLMQQKIQPADPAKGDGPCFEILLRPRKRRTTCCRPGASSPRPSASA